MSYIERETEKSSGKPLPSAHPVDTTRQQPASWSDLFGAQYLRRTLVVWLMWFAAYLITYGLTVWLPTIYRTVFHLPLALSLQYGLLTQVIGLLGTLTCALTIDYFGRRPWFAVLLCRLRNCARHVVVHRREFTGACLGNRQHCIFLFIRFVNRRLSLHARALSDASTSNGSRNSDGLAAARLDDWTERRRIDDRRRTRKCLSRVRSHCGHSSRWLPPCLRLRRRVECSRKYPPN